MLCAEFASCSLQVPVMGIGFLLTQLTDVDFQERHVHISFHRKLVKLMRTRMSPGPCFEGFVVLRLFLHGQLKV